MGGKTALSIAASIMWNYFKTKAKLVSYSVLKELVTEVLEEWTYMGLNICICVATCIRVVFF